jgi:hypothetical protein
MSDTQNTAPLGVAAGTVLPAPPSPVAPPATPPSATAQPVGLTSDQLKARLDETRMSALAQYAKTAGYNSVEELNTAIKAARDAEQSRLSETERLQKELERLKPVEGNYATLKAQYDAYASREFAALPEAAQKAIDAQAGGDAVKRMQLIELGRAAGWIGGSPVTPSAQAPAPVTTGPSAPAPSPVTTQTAFQKWQAFQQTDMSGIQAKIFYEKNRAEIERTKPQGQ